MLRMACRACVMTCLASFAGTLVAWGAAAAGIATVTDVTNEGYRKPPGAGELPVAPADELVTDEALRTGAESTIEVKFVDGSELSVEALSEVVLSDYVFDPEVAASTGVINLNVGLFRFNSNDLPDSGLQLKTPVATIGIRGTEFLVTVTADRTVVDIVDGLVEVAPVGDGQAITCEGGQSILVAGPDEDAICGDFGAFNTAAGEPGTQTADAGSDGEPRSAGGRADQGGASGGGDPGGGDPGGGDPGGGDPGGGDPGGGDPGGGGEGHTNHSGHSDGTNPGKGHGNGNGNHGSGNGGKDNPGGGR